MITSCGLLTNSRKPVVIQDKVMFVCADHAFLTQEERVIPPLKAKGNAAFKQWTGVTLNKYGVLNGAYGELLACVAKYHPEVNEKIGN